MRESNMRSNVSQDLVGFRTASPELIDTEGLVQDRPTQTAY